jgi:hypothetical protein
MQNELGLVIADRSGPLVPSFGVAHPETRRSGLNEPDLLSPGQNGESQKGKTAIGGYRLFVANRIHLLFYRKPGHYREGQKPIVQPVIAF